MPRWRCVGAFRVVHGSSFGRWNPHWPSAEETKGALGYTKYPTQDPNTPWDAGKARAALRKFATSGGKVDYAAYAKGFAYVVSGETEKLGSYKFPHHNVAGGIKTNLKGCRAGIAVVAGGRGGANVSAADRKGIYNHLAKHIKDDFNAPVKPFEDLGKMSEEELLAYLELTPKDLVDFEPEGDEGSEAPPEADPNTIHEEPLAEVEPITQEPAQTASLEVLIGDVKAWQVELRAMVAAVQQTQTQLRTMIESMTPPLEAHAAALAALDGNLADVAAEVRTLVQSTGSAETRLADLEKCFVKLLKWETLRLAGAVGIQPETPAAH